jgi:Na+-translocating ferredoxin:NAD+ oxidoreductase RNF subunit RnfB
VAEKWMPAITEVLCTGCGLCVEACGPKSLAMADGKAVLASPDTCGSEEHCISACPEDAIRMAWFPLSSNPAVGKWALSAHREYEPLESQSNGTRTAETARSNVLVPVTLISVELP